MTNWKELDNGASALHTATNAVARAEVARRKHPSDTTERAVARARKHRQKVREELVAIAGGEVRTRRSA